MEPPTEQKRSRYRVTLADVLRHLDEMSNGAEQWMGIPLAPYFISNEGNNQRYILVAYSDPDPTNLPNTLVYGVPIEHRSASADTPAALLCCLAPEHLVPISRGLYWLNDLLDYDPFEDMARFWEPLKKQVLQPTPAPDSTCSDTSKMWTPDTIRETMDGMTYRYAVRAKLIWLSQSKQRIQNAIWR